MRAKALVATILTLAASAVASVSPSATPAEALTKPNIVLVLTDDQTFDALRAGAPTVMPNLESWLADPGDHWVQFPNFFFNNPLCCPSRATILTGQYSHKTGVETNVMGHQLDESSTIATWLDSSGYRTGLIGKYLNDYPFGRGDYVPPGWDYWAVHTGLGNLGYYNYKLYIKDGAAPGARVTYKFSQNDYSTKVLTGLGTDFIGSTPPGTPFFLELSLAASHGPWQAEAQYVGAFPGVTPYHAPNFNEADVSDKPAWVQALPQADATTIAQSDADELELYRTLLSVDDAMLDLRQSLESKGVLENTIIVFMTDNGSQFLEHRWAGKRCEYDTCLRSPFFVRYPGAAAGVDTRLVSNVDVAPTLAELGVATPTISQDGMSLVPILSGGPVSAWRTGVLIHNSGDGSDTVPTFWGVRTTDYAYVEISEPANATPSEYELYDITGQLGPPDPFELQNQASNPVYAGVRAQLAEQLAELKGVDLSVTMSDNPDPVNVGSKVTYTATVSNNGLGTAYSTAFSDPVPAGATIVSAVPSQGSCDLTVSCALGTIAGGKKATVTVTMTATSPGTITNTATASGPAPDPTASDATDTETTTAILVVKNADLSVTLTDSPDPVPAGGKLTYTAKVTNSGPDASTGTTLTDTIPSGTTFSSVKPGSKCGFSAGAVTCSLGSIPAGSTSTVTITVVASVIGPLSNTVGVSATSTDPDSADLTATTSTTVTDPNADMSVAITDSPDPIVLGSGNITYSIVATNNGPANASGVRVIDTLPAGATFVSAKPGTRCSLASGILTCSLGNLASGASITVTLVLTPTATGALVNPVSASSSAPDPNTANNSKSATTTVKATLAAWGRFL